MKLVLHDQTYIEIINNDPNSGELFSAEGSKVVTSVSNSLDGVVKFAGEAFQKIRETIGPDRIEMEFGAEAGGEGGLFGIAKAHANATIRIKLEWSEDQSKTSTSKL